MEKTWIGPERGALLRAKIDSPAQSDALRSGTCVEALLTVLFERA